MQNSRRFHHVLRLVVAFMVVFAFLPGIVNVSAQPTQALTKNWRNTDFNFNGKMLDIDANGNTYTLGDTPATFVLNIKKFNPNGNLLWQNTYDDPTYNLSGVWIEVDGAGSAVVLANIVRSTDG